MKRGLVGNIFIAFTIVFVNSVPAFAQSLIAESADIDLAESILASDPTDATETPVVSPPDLPDILISEVQTSGPGTGTSGQEFIELYNSSTNNIDLTGYELIYVNSSGSQSLLYKFIEPILFLPDTYILGKLQASPVDFMPDQQFDFEYIKGTTGLAASEAGLKLINKNGDLVDEVAWVAAASSDKDTVTNLEGGKSAQRYILDGALVKNDRIANRYTVDQTNPRSLLEKVTPRPNEDEDEPAVTEDKEPSTAPVAINNPAILLNEILPDPASPQKDSEDEFIELFNPHNQSLDISGYKIIIKTSRESVYTLPKNSLISPSGYFTVTSGETSIALTNSGATITLADNNGRQIDSASYGESDSGSAWARAGGVWSWTISPTPSRVNIITAPVKVVKASKTTKASSKKSTKTKTNFANNPKIIINEIFPDPKSPLKDSKDEFIELYNPNDRRLNIADYEISAGSSKIYKHTLPAGAAIEPKGYYTVTSADTTLALTNSGGTVTLTDNQNVIIDTVTYAGVVAGQSWVLIDGKWQWTSTPTKNTLNKLSAVPNIAKASSKTSVSGASVAGSDDTPLVAAPQPLPGWLLAIIGVAAVCYAAYEYRFEARNYYYKYQRIRSPR